ncbi:MAG: hypothetical protein CM15mP128_1320 [Methanobacteriota archaeon]|nr:MAG: hypothetical protein CM15mP128_1320 [Euryarchaeota archaeon]
MTTPELMPKPIVTTLRRDDPASARWRPRALQSMTKKMLGHACPDTPTPLPWRPTSTRCPPTPVKEEEARKCKEEILILWTDFFKPQHLENPP